MKIIIEGTPKELKKLMKKEPQWDGVPEMLVRVWLTEREEWLKKRVNKENDEP